VAEHNSFHSALIPHMSQCIFNFNRIIFSEFSILWPFVAEVKETVNVECLSENNIFVGTTCNYVFLCSTKCHFLDKCKVFN